MLRYFFYQPIWFLNSTLPFKYKTYKTTRLQVLNYNSFVSHCSTMSLTQGKRNLVCCRWTLLATTCHQSTYNSVDIILLLSMFCFFRKSKNIFLQIIGFISICIWFTVIRMQNSLQFYLSLTTSSYFHSHLFCIIIFIYFSLNLKDTWIAILTHKYLRWSY